jgi:hypothetical protein
VIDGGDGTSTVGHQQRPAWIAERSFLKPRRNPALTPQIEIRPRLLAHGLLGQTKEQVTRNMKVVLTHMVDPATAEIVEEVAAGRPGSEIQRSAASTPTYLG